MAINLAAALRVMLVTDDDLVTPDTVVERCRAAVRGGVTSVQLRLKHCPPRQLVGLARELVAALPVPVLVNDRLDVAVAAGAAGAHLGPDDLPVGLARRFVPPGFVLGASVGGEGEVEGARGADYWGIGPWRVTLTKPGAGAPLGEAGFRRLAGLAGATPCVAIGGILPEDVGAVRAAGGAGVAVVSGILGDSDARRAAVRYVTAAARHG